MQTILTIALAQLKIATDPDVNFDKAEIFIHCQGFAVGHKGALGRGYFKTLFPGLLFG